MVGESIVQKNELCLVRGGSEMSLEKLHEVLNGVQGKALK